MVANFKWNAEKEYLGGDADLNGWEYDLYTVSSDKDSASIVMIHNVGSRSLALLDVVHEEDELSGTYEVDTCYNATLAGTNQGTGPECITAGTFNLSRQ